MSVSHLSSNLLTTRTLACLIMVCSLALAGCGAGSETKENSAQASSESGSESEETGNSGNDGQPEEPEQPAVLNMVSQPSNATVAEGSSHTFVVIVEHENPITVTWYFNGSMVQRSAGTSYTASAEGTYDCVVTDGASTLHCRDFSLSYTEEPAFLTINSQPSNQMVNVGVDVMLAVGATGSGDLSYQWYFNGEAIAGANGSSLVLSAVTLADDGEYQVVVSNNSHTMPSDVATVSVAGGNLGQALITWERPTLRADESPLDEGEIVSYEIYYSDSLVGSMELIESVDSEQDDYTASGLAQGTHYFSLVTVDESGLKSDLSSPVSVTIN